MNSLHFYIKQIVSNSLLLVFNSEQRHITSYGNATNWNSTGYVELHYLVRKYRVKFCRKAQWYYKGNVRINDHKSFYIQTRLCIGKRFIENFIRPWKQDGKLIFQKLFDISHTLIFKLRLTKSSYWGLYCVVDLRTRAGFCDGVEICVASKRTLL